MIKGWMFPIAVMTWTIAATIQACLLSFGPRDTNVGSHMALLWFFGIGALLSLVAALADTE